MNSTPAIFPHCNCRSGMWQKSLILFTWSSDRTYRDLLSVNMFTFALEDFQNRIECIVGFCSRLGYKYSSTVILCTGDPKKSKRFRHPVDMLILSCKSAAAILVISCQVKVEYWYEAIERPIAIAPIRIRSKMRGLLARLGYTIKGQEVIPRENLMRQTLIEYYNEQPFLGG